MKVLGFISVFFWGAWLSSYAQTLKVMSYNIHIGQDVSNKDQLQQMAKFIKSSGADMVGLQEVDSVCNRSGRIDQMKFPAFRF
jgi:endonuclease/exonuclease/phosphatase family metal-dependent hydrolase